MLQFYVVLLTVSRNAVKNDESESHLSFFIHIYLFPEECLYYSLNAYCFALLYSSAMWCFCDIGWSSC